ncbi:biotin--[acetyl-CoA-carboxylase] ligase [Helicobacter sp.]|uniref:biotin--[acetyl-CoA-carboxylase] ligase n=1 Tax=Helicobacter sp. TaxID=218 RepID=UPI0025BD97A0|nr:biotin--[acetyl-CoA-carboxylase] ligase [Helicobacter sp.]MCI5633460.1 biotin--[acetyl-CoA-carboxylase] ligase [Helicobacter sp.]MDY5557049.1 biotin--[acetyl-CoA-carboxylase] ligase [Helicobacter sp.]
MMQVLHFECLESTQLYLNQQIRTQTLSAPVIVIADKQSRGIGSRGNVWENVKEGLYFSFAIPLSMLPQDLPLEAISIYMGFIFKEILKNKGSEIWLKWPNDLYVGEKKAGGILCSKIDAVILVGIGINLEVSDVRFGALDIKISKESILESLIEILENSIKKLSWKQIFSKYALEFPLNFSYSFHHKGKIVSMCDSVLCDDGAILIAGEKVYSLR